MHKKSSVETLPLDHEIERILFRRKKEKAANAEMEAQNSDRFSEGHSNHNEIPGVREPTQGNYWRLIRATVGLSESTKFIPKLLLLP